MSIVFQILFFGSLAGLLTAVRHRRRREFVARTRRNWEAFDRCRAGLDRTQMLTLKQLGQSPIIIGLVLLFGLSIHIHWSLHRHHHRHTMKIDRPMVQEMRR